MPDLAALELFVAVARHGSIGAAARHAGISQQAASARLRAMEAQVGAVLLDRDPRGSRLTPAGALLVDWAAPLLALASELDTGIASLRRARDAQLRVASSLTVAEHLLPAWLVALRGEYEQAGRAAAEITLVAANSEAVAALVGGAQARTSVSWKGPARRTGCGPGWWPPTGWPSWSARTTRGPAADPRSARPSWPPPRWWNGRKGPAPGRRCTRR